MQTKLCILRFRKSLKKLFTFFNSIPQFTYWWPLFFLFPHTIVFSNFPCNFLFNGLFLTPIFNIPSNMWKKTFGHLFVIHLKFNLDLNLAMIGEKERKLLMALIGQTCEQITFQQIVYQMKVDQNLTFIACNLNLMEIFANVYNFNDIRILRKKHNHSLSEHENFRWK